MGARLPPAERTFTSAELQGHEEHGAGPSEPPGGDPEKLLPRWPG